MYNVIKENIPDYLFSALSEGRAHSNTRRQGQLSVARTPILGHHPFSWMLPKSGQISLQNKMCTVQTFKNTVGHISEKNFSTRIASHLDGIILRVLFVYVFFFLSFSTLPLVRKLEILYHCYFIISSSTCADFSNYCIIKFDILLFYFVL